MLLLESVSLFCKQAIDMEDEAKLEYYCSRLTSPLPKFQTPICDANLICASEKSKPITCVHLALKNRPHMNLSSTQIPRTTFYTMATQPPEQPIDPSTLIFPSASTSIASTLTTLKRSNLSLTNRLHSIASDSTFVQQTADSLNLPLIANERCGSWYIPLSRKAGSAYFKSTDGHHGQWSFSLRRLNLQVLDVIERRRGG